MSIQAVGWVLDHSASRGITRLVLISLANHHNGGTGQCNPGQRLIAREAGIATGTVSGAIARLVELGEVVVDDAGGSHRSARYVLPFAQDMSEVPGNYARPMRGQGERSARPGARRTVKTDEEPRAVVVERVGANPYDLPEPAAALPLADLRKAVAHGRSVVNGAEPT